MKKQKKEIEKLKEAITNHKKAIMAMKAGFRNGGKGMKNALTAKDTTHGQGIFRDAVELVSHGARVDPQSKNKINRDSDVRQR